jgi:hypothetical protein
MMKGRTNQEDYMVFCENFIKCIIGSSVFKCGFCNLYLDQYCNESDEAVAFLILMNNWKVWEEMEEHLYPNGTAKEMKDCVSKQLFMVDGPGRKHSWSIRGRDFYNDMFAFVEEDRKRNGEAFNIAFLQRMKGCADRDKDNRMAKRNRNKSDVGIDRVVRCRHASLPGSE